ncbi:MAG: beta-ketoacyl synthase [Bacteroidetes bacterium]|nr:beta-ketoacyl synthase [Bacteroidota bacterium]
MNVFVAADNIISPLGFSSKVNFDNLKQMKTGVQFFENSSFSNEPVHAAIIDEATIEAEFQKLHTTENYTKLEKLAILSIQNALNENKAIDIISTKTLVVFSSTKGNIDLLDSKSAAKFDKKRLLLWETANVIARHFGNPNTPIIISNACISGVLALILAKRLLEENQYENIVVVGVDLISHFVVSGFQSFKAISTEIAKPYDANRTGISLGEAAGTIILTNNKEHLNSTQELILVKGGASSNDANHISGPSRTGDGLLLAIEKSLQESNLTADKIDFISGHGTATLFNDEMEALAINDAHLENVPMNSLKSYFGHTLGAAGIIESVVTLESMRNNILIGTYSYSSPGTSKPVNILSTTQEKKIINCIKTAAGFGGCNAAIVFSKQ